MTERELSQRLDELANRLDSDQESNLTMQEVAAELRKLSNEKYTPGHTSWENVKKQAKSPTRRFPF